MPPMAEHDRYSQIDYGSLIDWDSRLKREWPFLEELFRSGPSKRVLDLGSGPGEHARFIAEHGYSVVGLDQSQSMLERARSASAGGDMTFVEGDLREVANAVDGRFGAAICLGNVLPHLLTDDDLARFANGLRLKLETGAPVALQFLNYDRIEAKKERALPVVFRPDPADPAASIVFLRLMELLPAGRVIFAPTMLRFSPGSATAVELAGTERIEIRGWRRGEVERIFRAAGFESVEVWGSFAKEPFVETESRDVLLVAR